jgi:hypothetical protein
LPPLPAQDIAEAKAGFAEPHHGRQSKAESAGQRQQVEQIGHRFAQQLL